MSFRSSTLETTGQSEAALVSRYRRSQLGAVAVGEVLFLRDCALDCDDIGTSYFVHLPMSGRFESRHRGGRVLASRDAVPVYRPEGGSFRGRWEAGTRALCVVMSRGAVDAALARLVGDHASSRIDFEPTMNTAEGFGRAWLDLLMVFRRQLHSPDGLLAQPLVAAPLAEGLVNGFLLASVHSHSAALAAPVKAARPAAVRAAIDLIEAAPQNPLTVETLAAYCGVGVRTLQNGFRQHLGMSPMAYVRTVRLRRAHEELRAADASEVTVTAVARRWGFHHPGRFAAAHEARYGQSPAMVLRSMS